MPAPSELGLDPAVDHHPPPRLCSSSPASVSPSRNKLRTRHCSRDNSTAGILLHCVPEEEQESNMTGETGVATTMTLVDPDVEHAALWDKQLERRGLFRGTYYGQLALYSLTPFTTLVTFIFLAILPSLVYPLESKQWKTRYPTYLPFPLPELLTSVAFSSLSHLLRTPIFSLASVFETSHYIGILSILVACATYTAAALFLRLCSFALLLLPPDEISSSGSTITTKNPIFRIVWWTGLGWALTESAIAITQGYQSISLYKDVLVSVHRQPSKSKLLKDGDNGKGKQTAPPRDASDVAPPCSSSGVMSYGTWTHATEVNVLSPFEQASSSANVVPPVGGAATETQPLLAEGREGSNVSVGSSFASLSLHPSVAWDHPAEDVEREESELQVQVDRDIDHLVAFRKREELEELYGMPFIKIPVFISCLHRVNSFLQSLGFNLLLAAAYIYAFFPDTKLVINPVNTITDALTPHPVWCLALGAFGVHFVLTVLHTPLLLPKLGVHTVVYLTFMIGLGTLFVALAVWGGVS